MKCEIFTKTMTLVIPDTELMVTRNLKQALHDLTGDRRDRNDLYRPSHYYESFDSRDVYCKYGLISAMSCPDVDICEIKEEEE